MQYFFISRKEKFDKEGFLDTNNGRSFLYLEEIIRKEHSIQQEGKEMSEVPVQSQYPMDKFRRTVISVMRFDITDIGGRKIIPDIHRQFLRMYIPRGRDPLRNEWIPVLDLKTPGRICCLTASRAIASILEDMEAKRAPLEAGKGLAVVC